MAASRRQGTALSLHDDWFGALAQLGERNTGSVEVSGSIPLGSTIHLIKVGSSMVKSATLADEVSSAGVFRMMRMPRHSRGVAGDV